MPGLSKDKPNRKNHIFDPEASIREVVCQCHDAWAMFLQPWINT